MLLHTLMARLLVRVELVIEPMHGLGVVLDALVRERVYFVLVVLRTWHLLQLFCVREVRAAAISYAHMTKLVIL